MVTAHKIVAVERPSPFKDAPVDAAGESTSSPADPNTTWTDSEAARISDLFDDLDDRFADDWPGAL